MCSNNQIAASRKIKINKDVVDPGKKNKYSRKSSRRLHSVPTRDALISPEKS